MERVNFSDLSPQRVLNAAEDALDIGLESVVTPYNSYVNRVYGLKDEDGGRYIAKFYRPGRWSREAIAEEHALVEDCARSELPVVPPLPLRGCPEEGPPTLGDSGGIPFAVYPFRGGRTFDLSSDEDYLRAGRLIGRIHAVSRQGTCPSRPVMEPEPLYVEGARRLAASGAVHPDLREEFLEITGRTLEECGRRFREAGADKDRFIRIHGDCHRGNLLETADGSLQLIDFDDAMTGPAVQDLWLLLPGRLNDSRREMELLLEGYTEFSHFDRSCLSLVEPLRFMRMLYFLDWHERQREDDRFRERYPDWGSRAFWIREIEDLRDQARAFGAGD